MSIGERSFRHGHTAGRCETPEYKSWVAMKARCLNVNNHKYPAYGGRGIIICARWLDFVNFLADMGKRPRKTTLDRINSNGNYEPGNCRWATPLQQGQNTNRVRNITWGEQCLCLAEWARQSGLKEATLRYRLKFGWTFQKAISVPTRRAAR